MPDSRHSVIVDGELRLDLMVELASRPEPWARGEALFWDDPHIATQMLAAHLDPDTTAASAPPDVVDASVEWMVDRLGLEAGDSLIDLGCGPGLYTRRFTERGLAVTGIDISESSIVHARSHDPDSTYRHGDYLGLADEDAFDVATLIYGDFCALDDRDRATLLANVHRALTRNGWFVLDVSTAAHHARHNCGNGWVVRPDGGFWKPVPYLGLMRHFTYPDLDLAVDQYAIVEADGTLSVYRNWFRYFDADSITAELRSGGFEVEGLYADLRGSAFDPDGTWIGVVARRR